MLKFSAKCISFAAGAYFMNSRYNFIDFDLDIYNKFYMAVHDNIVSDLT